MATNAVYYPFLRTRASELDGLSNVDADRKRLLTPVFTMGQWRKKEGTELPLEKIQESFSENRFILDISRNIKDQNNAIQALLNEEKHYQNWIDFSRHNPAVIPVVQTGKGSSQRSFVRQAMALEQNQNGVSFRINSEQDAFQTIGALNALEDPDSAIILVDAQYIRDLTTNKVIPSKLKTIIDVLNLFNTEFPLATKVLSSTSFPRSVTQFFNGADGLSGRVDILENTLYEEIGNEAALYGDHASIHSEVYDQQGGRFLPRIDIPKDGYWYFERRPGMDAEGFVEAANSLLASHPHLQSCKYWGERMITQTAAKDEIRIKAPATAIAVRVNLHINYQIDLMEQRPTEDEDSWDL